MQRNVMKKLNINELAKDMNVSIDTLKKTFDDFNKSEKGGDKFGRKF